MSIPIVIQAGGRGVRLHPFTEILPKALVPLDDGTIIEEIIRNFTKQRFTDYHIIINYLGDLIKTYLSTASCPHNINYVEEKRYRGTAGALKLLDLDTDFILSNCDIFIDTDYNLLYDYHKDRNADMTIVATRQINKLPYGVFDYEEDNRVKSITEKPETVSIVNTGMYVFKPDMMELINDEHMDMNELIQEAISKNKRVYLYHIKNDKYTDVGTLKSYKEYIASIGGTY